MRALLLFGVTGILLSACGREATALESPPSSGPPARTDTVGACAGICDASPPSIPVVSDSGGFGDVTTYGGVGNSNPSSGGACNYGATGITHYAAIQVNLQPGDGQGQWLSGAGCGQCAEVQARTPEGWKRTVVRIVDKCPDGQCGIDLGGAPATDLMGTQPGRYSGQWRFVSCLGLPGVSDGAPSLFVKEGSSVWWSLVQVRNPESAITTMRLRSAPGSAAWDTLPWATEAENFFKVPAKVFRDTLEQWDLEAWTRNRRVHAVRLQTRALSHGGSSVAFDTLR